MLQAGESQQQSFLVPHEIIARAERLRRLKAGVSSAAHQGQGHNDERKIIFHAKETEE
jgi:hypothetical protein